MSGPDYQAGVQPYLDTIAATTLPPRFTKGDPRNLDRVKIISQALRNVWPECWLRNGLRGLRALI